ncbi:MAG TPA: AGE family epimerase/isomerase [Chitinophagaceae bacterium]|nr:AGE family epimerase/isomerase [Chitinophagaceae bacterium]
MKRMLVLLLLYAPCLYSQNAADRKRLASEIEYSMKKELLDPWYPQSVDQQYGGFLSTYSFDFKPTGAQDKMIVTQARHVWSNSKAALLYPDIQHYKTGAAHGFRFLRDKMWDHEHRGFYTLVSRDGTVKGEPSKTAYGNAFGIYALAAYYAMSKDTGALSLAKIAFLWLEKNSHDPVYKGYFQHLSRNGEPQKRSESTPSTSDLGYKDQNSSIHLLEAFTELYMEWPDSLLRERLQEMLLLIRDTITTEKGYLTLFLTHDWKPVSFRGSSKAVILKHRNLDHVSFGHDIETAYLMLEASHVLGLKEDTTTLRIAKKMVDHALSNGWDNKNAGLFDEGYYFSKQPKATIIKNSKNWWAQAEALNTLLLMSRRFPNDTMQYFKKFKHLWQYAKTYLIDHKYGDWYVAGLDTSPQSKTAFKGHLWKATYHQFRALANCWQQLNQQQKLH